MKHPNPLMLLRIAQGDAYGLSCEYLKMPEHAPLLQLARHMLFVSRWCWIVRPLSCKVSRGT